jgi:hypothetical protein
MRPCEVITRTSSCDLCNWSLAACSAGATFPSDRCWTHVYEHSLDRRTFEDVTILQLLSVRTLSKTLLQTLKSFRAQRILAGWAGDGDRPRGAFSGSGGGGVGGSYDMRGS